jgi:hypothetical protein
MRLKAVLCCLVLLLVSGGGTRAQQAPQAFLLGAWTGGLFPAPTVISARDCLAQPTVIFTRDVVMRASVTDVFYIQRLVETARGTGNGVEFRFSPAGGPATPGLTGFSQGDNGFGCGNPDVLHVQRISQNEIRFPDCKDFSFPLVRCPAG